MGFRVRKSFKVMPGVRMTVSNRGFSVSAGNRGGRVTVNSRGRVTGTARVPGVPLSYTSSSSLGSRTRAAPGPVQPPTAPASAPPKPGMFAPRWEKDLFRIVTSSTATPADMQRLGADPAARATVAVYEVLLIALPNKDWERARSVLGWLRQEGIRPEADPFIQKYTAGASITLPIAAGVTVELPISSDGLNLLFAEIEQAEGSVARAIDIVESLDPSTVAAVSLAELYVQEGRWADVVSLTEGLTNEDDPSTYLLIQRGVAFREQGFNDAARESFKEALRTRSRSPELRQAAYVERGRTYLAEGKKSMASKDFGRVMSENSQFEGLAELVELAR